jgi:hypothetical protein
MFEIAEQKFDNRIDSLERVAEFLQLARQSAESVEACANISEEFKRSLGDVRTAFPACTRGLHVVMISAYESLVKSIIVEAFERRVSGYSSFEDMPKKLIEYYSRGLEASLRSPSKFALESNAVHKALSKLHSWQAGEPFDPNGLLPSVMAVTASHYWPKELSDALDAVGATGVWTKLGQQVELQVSCNASSPSNCEGALKTMLDHWLRSRNDTVHVRDSDPAAPSPETILDQCKMCRLLCKYLVISVRSCFPALP